MKQSTDLMDGSFRISNEFTLAAVEVFDATLDIYKLHDIICHWADTYRMLITLAATPIKRMKKLDFRWKKYWCATRSKLCGLIDAHLLSAPLCIHHHRCVRDKEISEWCEWRISRNLVRDGRIKTKSTDFCGSMGWSHTLLCGEQIKKTQTFFSVTSPKIGIEWSGAPNELYKSRNH